MKSKDKNDPERSFPPTKGLAIGTQSAQRCNDPSVVAEAIDIHELAPASDADQQQPLKRSSSPAQQNQLRKACDPASRHQMPDPYESQVARHSIPDDAASVSHRRNHAEAVADIHTEDLSGSYLCLKRSSRVIRSNNSCA